MKPLLPILAVAAFWCADVAAQQQAGAGAATRERAADKAVDGYRFVKLRSSGEYYIDYDAMGAEARDDERFAALAERFIAVDPALVVEDLQVLYYGRAYRDDYTGDRRTFTLVEEAMQAGQYDRAYQLCLDLQRRIPASPRLLNLLYISASKKSIPAAEPELTALADRYRFVLDVISFSGNGTMLSPYVVTSVADEYELLFNKLGITAVVMQQLTRLEDGTMCDIMTVSEGEGSDSENDEVWFDIDMPFGASAELFE